MKKLISILLSILILTSSMAVAVEGASSSATANTTVEFTISVFSEFGYIEDGDYVKFTLPSREVGGVETYSYAIVSNGVSYQLGTNGTAATTAWGNTVKEYTVTFGTLCHSWDGTDTVVPQSILVGDSPAVQLVGTFPIEYSGGVEVKRVKADSFKLMDDAGLEYKSEENRGWYCFTSDVSWCEKGTSYDICATKSFGSVSYCWDWQPVDKAADTTIDTSTGGIRVLNGTAFWDAIPSVTAYLIYFNGVYVGATTQTFYTVTSSAVTDIVVKYMLNGNTYTLGTAVLMGTGTSTTPDSLDTGIPGDISGDGKTNSRDLLALAKRLAGWSDSVNDRALDTDGNSRINSRDLLNLAKFLAGWDVTLYYDNSFKSLAYTLSADGSHYIVSGIGTYTDSLVIIPDAYEGLPVTEIAASAFTGNTAITGIILPNGVTVIGDNAFNGCTSLDNVFYKGTKGQWQTLLADLSANDNAALADSDIYYYSSTAPEVGDTDNYWYFDSEGNIATYTPVYSEGLEYSLDTYDNVYVVMGLGSCTDETVIIPKTYNGLPVVEINSLYRPILSGNEIIYNTSVKSVIIPAGVTYINSMAFSYLQNLEEVKVSESNTYFYSENNCIISSSGSVYMVVCDGTIPTDPSVTAIGYNAFGMSYTASSIHIPANIIAIYDRFGGCRNLTELTVDNANPVYRSSGNCLIETATKTLIAACKTFEIPTDGSVETIGQGAFNSAQMSQLTIPEGIKALESGALSSASILVLPSSLEYVNTYAFNNGARIFYKGTPAEWAELMLNNSWFNGTVQYYSETEPNDTENTYWHYVDGRITVWGEEDLVFSEGLEFSYNSYSNTYNVTGLGSCTDETVIIPEYYNDLPVTGVQSLQVVLGTANYDTNVKKVVITSNIQSINDGAFTYLKGLEEIEVTPSNGYYYSENNCIITKADGEIILAVGNATIPTDESVTSIMYDAFGMNFTASSLNIPANIEVIYGGFGYCPNLTELTVDTANTVIHSYGNCIIHTATKTLVAVCKNFEIPTDGSVEGIGSNVFAGLGITEFTVPNGVKTLQTGSLSGIDKIVMPVSLETVGPNAFSNTAIVYYMGTPAQWAEVDFNTYSSWHTCKVYYYSETEPVDTENAYWHYVDGEISVWDEENLAPSEGLEFSYNSYSNTYNVTGLGSCTDEVIVIPETYNGLPVESVYSFSRYSTVPNTTIKKVVLTENISYVSASAFANLVALEEVKVTADNAVFEVRDNCILSKQGSGYVLYAVLRNGTVPTDGSVFAISSNAYSANPDITSVTIPASVKSILGGLFGGCNKLTEVKVDSANTVYHALGNCIIQTATKTLVSGCKTSVIPTDGSVKTIGQFAFNGVYLGNVFTVPEGIETLSAYALNGAQITGIVLPKSLTTLQTFAFSTQYVYYCGTPEDWQNVTVQTSGYDWLTAAVYYYSETEPVDTENTYWHYVDGVPTVYPQSVSVDNMVFALSYDGTYYICQNVRNYNYNLPLSISVPSEYNGLPVKEIGINVFSAATELYIPESVEILPDTITVSGLKIIEVAAANPAYRSVDNCLIKKDKDRLIFCSSIGVVPTDGSIKIIGSYALANKTFTEFVIPDGVSDICSNAFLNCLNLTTITIPESTVYIAEQPFNMCNNLSTINIASGNTSFAVKNNCLVDLNNKVLIHAMPGAIVPTDGSVKTIGTYSFQNNTLTSVEIPEGVEAIISFAFYYCSGLTEVELPDSLKTIERGAFASTAISSIEIPKGVTSFEGNPLYLAHNLTSITVDPANTVYHSSGNCLIETATNTLIAGCKTSVIPDGVTALGDEAFYNVAISSIVLPKTVTKFGKLSLYPAVDMSNDSYFTVYYEGSADEFAAIERDDNSIRGIVCYYSETDLNATDKNYWHYVNGVPTLWNGELITAIPVPQNVSAVYSEGTVTVTWDAVEGANGYKVYIILPNYPALLLTNAPEDAASYTVSGLPSGTYGFKITAIVNGLSANVNDCTAVTVTAS